MEALFKCYKVLKKQVNCIPTSTTLSDTNAAEKAVVDAEVERAFVQSVDTCLALLNDNWLEQESKGALRLHEIQDFVRFVVDMFECSCALRKCDSRHSPLVVWTNVNIVFSASFQFLHVTSQQIDMCVWESLGKVENLLESLMPETRRKVDIAVAVYSVCHNEVICQKTKVRIETSKTERLKVQPTHKYRTTRTAHHR